ncbi:hypothetical protein Dimus_012776 [Dionaea muscipula]
MLRNEFELAMALIGCRSIKETFPILILIHIQYQGCGGGQFCPSTDNGNSIGASDLYSEIATAAILEACKLCRGTEEKDLEGKIDFFALCPQRNSTASSSTGLAEFF